MKNRNPNAGDLEIQTLSEETRLLETAQRFRSHILGNKYDKAYELYRRCPELVTRVQLDYLLDFYSSLVDSDERKAEKFSADIMQYFEKIEDDSAKRKLGQQDIMPGGLA